MFHTVRPRDKNDNKLKDCYKSCLQDVLVYDLKCITFCSIENGIREFDQRKAAEIALATVWQLSGNCLATVRLWLESNHSSADRIIFCTYENADYEL